MIRVTFRAHAYCVAEDGGPDGQPCGFDRHATWSVTTAEVRSEAQRHVQRTGHTVLVDVVDRTDYAPEPAGVTP
jgi:hypothetical protein